MKTNGILFEETQKFRQLWFVLIMLGFNSLGLYGIISQLYFGLPFGNNPASDSGLIIIEIGILVFTFLLMNVKLETQIKKDGIYVKFIPFIFKFKHFEWSQLEKTYITKYKPIIDYGGWGWRIGAKGKAYNISGNMGLQLVFMDNKKLLIGTQKPDEISQILNQLSKYQSE